MAYRAKRGVCIGVERHLKANDPVPTDLDPATVRFLVATDAIEEVVEPPPGKASDKPSALAVDETKPATDSKPEPSGKKEK